jgi:hypothetical protein
VANVPQQIVLKRHRDLHGREWQIWLRRGLFALVPIVVLLGLLNFFGQRPDSQTAAANGASLKVYAPSRVRSGLLFMARFHITARRDIKRATLVLGPGWLESMTVNTIEPSPITQASKNGALSLDLGHIPAGGSYLLFMDFQVNATNVGHRNESVTLYDGSRALLHMHREITIWP